MGQYLGRIEDDTAQALADAEQQLAALQRSREWELAKTAADAAGIVDPTPTSDAISLAMSVAEQDWVGAFLSGVSFIPYLGDAVAKPIKVARSTKAIAAIERQAAALAEQVAHYQDTAIRFVQRRMAAAAERARRVKAAAQRHVGNAKCASCNRFGSQLPKTGSWSGEKGHSRWTSDDGDVSLDYKEGYPDFSTSNPPSVYRSGDQEGIVEIEMTGKDSDFRKARDAMRKKLGDSNWPGNGKSAPEGYTWHHTEDGATIILVNKNVHNKAISGAAHTGGTSIVGSSGSQF